MDTPSILISFLHPQSSGIFEQSNGTYESVFLIYLKQSTDGE